MVLELDDEEFTDLRAAVLLQFKGALRDLAKSHGREARERLRDRVDRLEQLVEKLRLCVPSPFSAPH
jgi:hypothetical protein